MGVRHDARSADGAVPDSSLRESMTPFESVNYFVDRAARLAEIPDSMIARIRMPESELRVGGESPGWTSINSSTMWPNTARSAGSSKAVERRSSPRTQS